jgi:hypothetical protein
MQIAVLAGAEVAAEGVVLNILFEESNLMTAAMECLQQGAIRGSVTVSPGGRDCQSEERNLQRAISNVLTVWMASVERLLHSAAAAVAEASEVF